MYFKELKEYLLNFVSLIIFREYRNIYMLTIWIYHTLYMSPSFTEVPLLAFTDFLLFLAPSVSFSLPIFFLQNAVTYIIILYNVIILYIKEKIFRVSSNSQNRLCRRYTFYHGVRELKDRGGSI